MDAPAVAVDPTGKRFAVSWMDCQLQPGNRDVFWSVGGKETPLLSSDRNGQQGHPGLACSDKGVFWSVWEDQRSGRSEIWSMRSEKGARNRRLSDLEEDGPCFFPAVDADDGLVAVAYETETRNVVLRIVEDVQ